MKKISKIIIIKMKEIRKVTNYDKLNVEISLMHGVSIFNGLLGTIPNIFKIFLRQQSILYDYNILKNSAILDSR